MSTAKNTAKKIQVKQVRSAAGRSSTFRSSLDALGLGRIGKQKVLPLNQSVAGAVRKVAHVVTVTEIK